MKFVYSDRYNVDVGVHVFRMDKYRLIREQLVASGQLGQDSLVEPELPDPRDIRLVHSREYVDDLLNLRWTSRTVKSELPLTWEIVQAYMLHAAGTIKACQLALDGRVAMHLGGGFHHAFADHGEGFCYINDIAVGIRRALADGKITRAAVIDCDLHQGNGTARIFAGDDRVFTFSIHQERLYPVKEDSDLDVGLDDDSGDEEYVERLGQALPPVLDQHRPELVIYVAGADPYHDDQLGTLRLTKRGLALRDRMVIEGCCRRGIPVVPVLAGGYALDVNDTVAIHLNTARECLRVLGELKPSPAEEGDSGEKPVSGPVDVGRESGQAPNSAGTENRSRGTSGH